MKALQFERSIGRYAASRVVSVLKSTATGGSATGAAARVGPLALVELDEPRLPGPDWRVLRPRLAGVCGSDLATIEGRSSRYFEAIVSFPFVPGHEVVGDLDDGTRVVVEPVLGCVSRAITPVCAACARGELGRCEQISFGALKPGLQSGFCTDTGGGWSTAMAAHVSQLHVVPDELSDEDAVMIEPAACAVHGALAAGNTNNDACVVVIGAGTLGLLTTAALTRFNRPGRLIVAAKHPEQRRAAVSFGATVVVDPPELKRAVRRATSTMAVGEGSITRLAGGADVVYDCVGTAESIADALAVVRPGGTIVLIGMPGAIRVDLTPLWHREISLVGAYAYGIEPHRSGPDGTAPRTFELAFDLAGAFGLGRLVSAHYPLEHYQDALDHAGSAGRRGGAKVVFDLREQRDPSRGKTKELRH